MARAARGGALNLVGALVSGVTAFALATVVTNGHTKAEAGVFFTTTSLFLLATNLGQLGTNTGLVYFLSRARGAGTLRNARRYMRMGMQPVLVVGVLIAVAMWVWAEPLGALMSDGPVDSSLTTSIRWLAPFVPMAAVLNVSLSGTRGLGSMRANAIVDQLARPLLQLALVAIASWWLAAGHMATLWALPYLPLAVVAWWSWHKMMVRATRGAGPDPDYHPRRAYWNFTLPRGLAGVAQVAMQRLDVILVGSLAGIAPAAVYAATTRFLSLGLLARRRHLPGRPATARRSPGPRRPQVGQRALPDRHDLAGHRRLADLPDPDDLLAHHPADLRQRLRHRSLGARRAVRQHG